MSLEYIDGGILAMPAKIDERFVYLPTDFLPTLMMPPFLRNLCAVTMN